MPSPTPSVNEYDISNSLFASGGGSDDESLGDGAKDKIKAEVPLDFDIFGSDNDDEAIIAASQAASNRKSANIKGRSVKKGGGFQAMGLSANILKAITRKGFSVPTPIQRKTIPLLLQEMDVVGMARTGSGKTAAFVIPLIERLKGHSTKVGARALIMSPSRELALQTLQVVKELGRGTDIKCVLLVGGDSLEEQFAAMTANPDIVIATPGRFLHLKVEMGLDLSSMRYVVFDEADRLFEMGFAAQLTEILHALPTTRQTLLFSATLPKSLVEFAKAGLQEPKLVRLDLETKISPDLQNAFFTLKSSEKEGALLHILQNVIELPTRASDADKEGGQGKRKAPKRKRGNGDEPNPPRLSNPHSTIVFAATKHHVEYIAHLLRLAGYPVSYVYGSLDQTARKIQVENFRAGKSNILVVTDVAARGIDIPVLANVINYDFPSQPKIFVHRVGRTARAGKKGWSFSLVTDSDAPYMVDLQLFLGKRLLIGRQDKEVPSYSEDVVVGGLPRDQLANTCEWVTKNLEDDTDLDVLRSVALKGEKLYQRTRNSASAESAKRSKDILASDSWSEMHPMLSSGDSSLEAEREKMLAIVGGFRPQESIFEIGARRGGKKGTNDAMEVMKKVRSTLDRNRQRKRTILEQKRVEEGAQIPGKNIDSLVDEERDDLPDNMSIASDAELEVTFSQATSGKGNRAKRSDPQSFQHSENFMSYTPANINMDEDRAYGVHSGSNTNFTQAARGVQMDLATDEGAKGFGEERGIMRWDKRQKKYVSRRNDDDGSKGTRLVRGESGAKIAASFRSGRFDAWKKANKVRLPKVGETETTSTVAGPGAGRQYRHKSTKAPKQADKYRADYEKRVQRVKEAKERDNAGSGKNELRSVDDIRKQRKLMEKRREKNARPSRKGRS